jgi:hypothetical protein
MVLGTAVASAKASDGKPRSGPEGAPAAEDRQRAVEPALETVSSTANHLTRYEPEATATPSGFRGTLMKRWLMPVPLRLAHPIVPPRKLAQ